MVDDTDNESGMTSRERVRRTLEFGTPDRPPRQLWHLPGVSMFRKNELDAMLRKYPSDFDFPRSKMGPCNRMKGELARKGVFVDAFGVPWVAGEDGVVGEVKEPPLADWSALDSFQPPWEILREADFSEVNTSCAESDKFMLCGLLNLFERCQHLRGTQNFLLDLAYGTAEAFRLIDMVHEYYLLEAELWAQTVVDGIQLYDDWGAQRALLINPEIWRAVFKPRYREYFDIIRKSGKFVFMHSDGCIEAIYEDLIEMGVHALNSQLFCMPVEELGARYKGRVTFWGEIDRQYILPFGTTEEVRDAVRRVHRALYDTSGGIIAQCEWGVRDPRENIETVFDEWIRLTEPNAAIAPV